MEFSEREIDRLYSAFKNSERLRVVACNGMGYPCELEGYVAMIAKDEMPTLEDKEEKLLPGIFVNALILDCGKISKYPKNCYRTPQSIMMFTGYEDIDMPTELLIYIKSIRSIEKNDVIYCNYEFDDLLECFEMSKKSFEEDGLKRGEMPATLDKDGQILNNNIGKPMKIGGMEGILTCATDIVPSGDICLFGMTGPSMFSTFLKRDKKIVIVNGVVCDCSKDTNAESLSCEM